MRNYDGPNDYDDLIVIEQETFIERYKDLDRHGNTVLNKKEYRRHRELIESKGYKAKYRRVNCKDGDYYYIVEVI